MRLGLRKEQPSGKHLRNYGKSPFLMGKLTISMAIFNSFLYVYQAGYTCRDLAEDDQVDGVQDPWWLMIIRDCTNQYVGGILTIHCL